MVGSLNKTNNILFEAFLLEAILKEYGNSYLSLFQYDINEKIVELQNAPYKKDAGKWQTALSWILQALTLACMAIILAKVGLK